VSRDDRIVLEVVDGPEDILTDDVVAALGVDKAILQMICEVFGPVTVGAVATPAVWPPRGGFVPAWRRVRPGQPLIVLPSEHVPNAINPFAPEPPSISCPTCTVQQTKPAVTEHVFETGPWQTCGRCGGCRWRSTEAGDVCVACGPRPGRAPAAATWVRAGGGWVCSRCHPIPPVDGREVCGVCQGKGRCRPDHNARLRQLGEAMLRRARSEAMQGKIRAALAAIDEAGR
jgi:hypothetical protein